VVDTGDLTGHLYDIDGNSCDFYTRSRDVPLKLKLQSADLITLEDGDFVSLRGIVYKNRETLNLDGFHEQTYLKARGYSGVIMCQSLSLLKNEVEDVWIRKMMLWVHTFMKRRSAQFSSQSFPLYQALILGKTERSDLFEISKALGLMHLFVISGFHFTLVALVISSGLKLLFKHRYRFVEYIRVGLCFVFYMGIEKGFGSMRALLMLFITLFSFLIKRKVNIYHMLAVFVLYFGICNPYVYFHLGFQLTMIATWGIIWISNQVKNLKMKKNSLYLLMISAGVFVFTGSILMWAMGSISLVGILLMPLLTPLIGALILLFLLYIFIGYGFLSTLLLSVIELLCNMIIDLIRFSSDFVAYNISLDMTFVFFFMVVTVTFVLSSRLKLNNWKLQRRAVLCMFISGCLLLSRVDWGFSVRTFALRDGESYLIKSPNFAMMYDVGNDVTILDLIKKSGVNYLDYIVISHAHEDHIGMMDQISKSIKVGEIITLVKDYRKIEHKDLVIELFGSRAVSQDLNDASIAALVTYKESNLLLTGDLESEGILSLMHQLRVDVDILKAPHHGSYNRYYQKMLSTYTPEYVIISGGRGKRVDKSGAIQDLTSMNLVFYDTIVDGELFIHRSGKKLVITTLGE
jgi:competence protein ComEC